MTDQTGTSTTRPAPAPVTDAEQIRWQRRAATLLGRLLELAAKRDLPAINWTVATGADLAGECLAQPHSDRRAQVGAWREALGDPDTFREAGLGDSGVQLTAVWDKPGKGAPPLLADRDGWRLARAVVYARILPDLDDE